LSLFLCQALLQLQLQVEFSSRRARPNAPVTDRPARQHTALAIDISTHKVRNTSIFSYLTPHCLLTCS
jgi:hypothetical protein